MRLYLRFKSFKEYKGEEINARAEVETDMASKSKRDCVRASASGRGYSGSPQREGDVDTRLLRGRGNQYKVQVPSSLEEV